MEKLTRRSVLIGASTIAIHEALANVADAMIPTPDSSHPKKTKPPIALMYHDINIPRQDNPDELDNWIPPVNFLKQLDQAIASGYRLGTLSDSLQAPGEIAALTFDDGIETAYSFVYPHLARQNIKATFFVPADVIRKGESSSLTSSQIRELSAAGIEIGSHSYRHQPLTEMGAKDRLDQLKTSKDFLENLIGKDVNLFAYPFGAYNKDIAEEVASVGYKAAFLGKNKPIGLPAPLDRFELPRYHITEDSDLNKIFAKRSRLRNPS